MQLAVGYLVGGLGYLIGLLLASLLDFPAGPLIVIALAGFSFFVLLIGRK
jgi:ABC-type Mn2+/Zn2+ transport system permease subunit